MITTTQLNIMRHALGYDHLGYLRSDSAGEYRNHYVSKPTKDLTDLCVNQLMYDCGSNSATGGMRCFRVSDIGKVVVRENIPKKPKYTRSQRRYLDFLNWSNATQGTFRQYLTYLKTEKQKI